jgi:hypothetical protein
VGDGVLAREVAMQLPANGSRPRPRDHMRRPFAEVSNYLRAVPAFLTGEVSHPFVALPTYHDGRQLAGK